MNFLESPCEFVNRFIQYIVINVVNKVNVYKFPRNLEIAKNL